MWYRVFCRGESIAGPAAILEHLHTRGFPARADFRGDDLGWTGAKIHIGVGSPIGMERYLTKEDELRDDLNSWAAFLETCDYSQNHAMLMERVIQTFQMITLRKPVDHADDLAVDKLCQELCRYFCAAADGAYQVEGDGWYDTNGALLLKEY